MRTRGAALTHVAASMQPYIALGILSAQSNQGRRTIIRQVSNELDSYASGRVALRFVLSVPPTSSSRAELLGAERDLVLLDGRETPFRCGLKYVLWFDVALRTFPGAAYVAAGDDDAYIQLSHLEADLRLVHAQVGAAPTLYGLFQWRSHYDNVTLDTSTGFMGWGFSDGRAMAVRRAMGACRDEVRNVSAQRRAALLAELLAARPGKYAARKGATSVRAPLSATTAAAFPRCAIVAKIGSTQRRREANEKRISAILLGRVEWEVPPFPVANGPLFAASRALASMVAADLALGDIDNPAPRADGAYAGPNGWVAQLEATELGRRWNASLQLGGKPPKELAGRRCWPNSDAALGLYVVKAALSRRRPITLVNTPISVQHFPWPVYSKERGFSNHSIVFHLHGRKRSLSPAWRRVPPRASGPFIAYNRTCGACDAMGWVSLPTSELAAWRCCGSAMKGSARARADDKGGRRARTNARRKPRPRRR